MSENSKSSPSTSTSKAPISKNVQNWIFIGWGFITLIIGLLLLSSFMLAPRKEDSNVVNPTKPVREVLSPQTLFQDDFNGTQLTGWVVDWVNLYEASNGSGNILLAYRNMLIDKRYPVQFIPMEEKGRFFYAKSIAIPININFPYRISFDFHGKGPIELINFGHIRLRLMEQLPQLSYDPNGNKTYSSFQIPSWNNSQLSQEIHSFLIEVNPNSQNYEITIDDIKIAKVHYSDGIQPINSIYFYEMIPTSGNPVVNAVYYDNFEVYGTPTHKLDIKEPEIPRITAPPSPVISPDYVRFYQTGWDKFNTREYQEALTYFSKAIEMNPNSAEAYNALGVTYRSLGDTTAAWQAWIKSLSIDSTYDQARKNLGMN